MEPIYVDEILNELLKTLMSHGDKIIFSTPSTSGTGPNSRHVDKVHLNSADHVCELHE